MKNREVFDDTMEKLKRFLDNLQDCVDKMNLIDFTKRDEEVWKNLDAIYNITEDLGSAPLVFSMAIRIGIGKDDPKFQYGKKIEECLLELRSRQLAIDYHVDAGKHERYRKDAIEKDVSKFVDTYYDIWDAYDLLTGESNRSLFTSLVDKTSH